MGTDDREIVENRMAQGLRAGTTARRGGRGCTGAKKGEDDNSLLPGIEGVFSFGRVFSLFTFRRGDIGERWKYANGNRRDPVAGRRLLMDSCKPAERIHRRE